MMFLGALLAAGAVAAVGWFVGWSMGFNDGFREGVTCWEEKGHDS